MARWLDAVIPARAVAGSRLPARGTFTFGGQTYGYPDKGKAPFITTWAAQKAEPIADDFVDLVVGGLQANAAVAAVEDVRVSVFMQARLMWQQMNNGRPGDLFWDERLEVLDRPWSGGTTGDLLARMLLHADFAGTAYTVRVQDEAGTEELVCLNPLWTDLLLAPRRVSLSSGGGAVGWRVAGWKYYQGGNRQDKASVFLPGEVAMFAPNPDPLATYRGRSWLTPVIREVMADKAATGHKLAFFENAATPNIAVTLPKEIDPADFDEFVELMEKDHAGAANAYRTLYLAGGADLTVIGANLQQLDFKMTQGAGETRIAAAGGVGAVLAKLSEGLAGSALNAGNFGAARRLFADTTARRLWQNLAGSMQVITGPVSTSRERLWVDDRDIPFLRDDAMDVAQIQASEATTIRTLLDAGFTPDSVKAAVAANDWSLLTHSGLYSVQLQAPGTGQTDSSAKG